MPYKSMENLYSTYCDSLVLKVTRIEREIERLKNLLIVNAEGHKETNDCIITLWHGVTESEVTKDNIYAIKRKESLLLSVLYRLDSEKDELIASQHEQEDEKSRLLQLRASYERKKRKWSLCQQKVKRLRSVKKIALEEYSIEECIAWKI
ncbi:TPA: hypothetical protein R8G72_000924 [Citrobacter youngae]|uniref:hypothetical protein n=1 Tax=Citrobacter TaxID=544 RepID=UPI00139CE011|nr:MULTISPECIES: hypothetical protein [Citrobacter]MBJ8956656.1 hypothetical protein [Citrobacter youngae]MBJ9556127.1 hypothetical protein [Citrobacter sp. FDAARGOS_156]HDX4037910.1 hypothetical protein [Citrobacter youngae]HEE0139848.1 hypothetical protein [Citrobacter youngae]HEF0070856.1 hypothetical protein [Citrobacter youngae]